MGAADNHNEETSLLNEVDAVRERQFLNAKPGFLFACFIQLLVFWFYLIVFCISGASWVPIFISAACIFLVGSGIRGARTRSVALLNTHCIFSVIMFLFSLNLLYNVDFYGFIISMLWIIIQVIAAERSATLASILRKRAVLPVTQEPAPLTAVPVQVTYVDAPTATLFVPQHTEIDIHEGKTIN
ncbi:hypothetical protein PROFUN_00417 [Planoprotostelium fungivorum]|uniref:Uncharacterized protein n=1 Tax=Planoprotostelium fungivorum TaxID=1890364 RepID=A0A2P6N0R5_9EUKA|nr:hypothetical protein PROFUN_00417 [Planoprotostelium fungivorum]